MLNLVTGLPGASKTLNTLRMVDQECKGRAVYYYGIKNCSMPGWILLTLDELNDWMSLPGGSVIVVDEAQDIWPPIPNTRPSPVSVQEMAKHRHDGKDFYIITQDPTFIDARIRKIAGPHFHYERAFGMKGAKELRFEKAENDPTNKSARALAQIQRRGFSQEYFDKYKSAEVHTYKPKMPRVVYVIGIAICCVGLLLASMLNSWGFFGGQSSKSKIIMGETPVHEGTPPGFLEPEFSDGPAPASAEQYAAQFKPRIEDVPWSAPAYDGVTEVKTFPRPQCMHRIKTDVCKCYTQQATPLDISHDICLAMVKGGWFNPYIAESAEGTGAEAGASPPAPDNRLSSVTENRQRVTVIPDRTRHRIANQDG